MVNANSMDKKVGYIKVGYLRWIYSYNYHASGPIINTVLGNHFCVGNSALLWWITTTVVDDYYCVGGSSLLWWIFTTVVVILHYCGG